MVLVIEKGIPCMSRMFRYSALFVSRRAFDVYLSLQLHVQEGSFQILRLLNSMKAMPSNIAPGPLTTVNLPTVCRSRRSDGVNPLADSVQSKPAFNLSCNSLAKSLSERSKAPSGNDKRMGSTSCSSYSSILFICKPSWSFLPAGTC